VDPQFGYEARGGNSKKPRKVRRGENTCEGAEGNREKRGKKKSLHWNGRPGTGFDPGPPGDEGGKVLPEKGGTI